jgi:hypothetical protein
MVLLCVLSTRVQQDVHKAETHCGKCDEMYSRPCAVLIDIYIYIYIVIAYFTLHRVQINVEKTNQHGCFMI